MIRKSRLEKVYLFPIRLYGRRTKEARKEEEGGQKKVGILFAKNHAIIQSFLSQKKTIAKQNKIKSRRTLVINYVMCDRELV